MENTATGRAITISPHMSFEQMLEALDNAAHSPHVITVPGDDLPDSTLCGAYMEPLRTILINSDMIEVQQRCTLVHELFHWVHADNECTPNFHEKNELTVRRETAQFLISPADYRAAERTYSQNTYKIACELNTTVAVVQDFQQTLQQPCLVPSHKLPPISADSRDSAVQALQQLVNNYQKTH